jgi:phosphate/phosphite/phosphonate ABC transporter binding protein
MLALVAILSFLAVTQPAPRAEAKPSTTDLSIVLVPYLTDEAMHRYFDPVFEHVGEKLGLRIEVQVAESYEDALQRVRSRKVQLAYLPPLSFVSARRDVPELRCLLTEVREGTDFYMGYWLTKDDSGIESIQQLVGARVAYVAMTSTTGYLAPMRFLQSRGVDLNQGGATITFTGDHLTSIMQLLSGDVDAVAVTSGVFSAARERGARMAHVRVLARTGVFPRDCIAAVGELPMGLEQRLVNTMLGMNCNSREMRHKLHQGFKLNGWRRSLPGEYDDIARRLLGQEP